MDSRVDGRPTDPPVNRRLLALKAHAVVRMPRVPNTASWMVMVRSDLPMMGSSRHHKERTVGGSGPSRSVPTAADLAAGAVPGRHPGPAGEDDPGIAEAEEQVPALL